MPVEDNQFPDHKAYGEHRNHKFSSAIDEDDTTSRNISCECGKSWRVANDPSGNLGSEEAPEG